MNALTVDPATGFLESSSPNFETFDADKKTILLDQALQMAERGEWPDINSLCKVVGIRVQTFYNHKSKDTEFRNRWEEVKRSVANEIAKTMAVHSKRPSNYMDRVTLLRHLYPEEWGGEAQNKTFYDFGWLKSAFEGMKSSAIDAEIVANTSTQAGLNYPQ